MTDLHALRRALLTLHRELLQSQRVQAERFGGRMSAAEVLQAATDDLRFGWLREVSQLLADVDEHLSSDEADRLPEHAPALVARARALFAPPDPQTSFGTRYLRALQDHPEVVMAHRDVVAALEA